MMVNMKIKTMTPVWIMLLFYGCSIASGSCPQGKPSIFLAEPRDVTVKEGSNVSFYCAINMTENSSSDVSITWDVSPGGLRRTVVRENMTSKLTVYNIGREKHYIRCKVNFKFSKHRETCRYSSRRATMTVQYFPRQNELICSTPNRSLSVHEGDSLHIQCQVTQANPSIDIEWRIDGHSFRQTPSTDNGLMRTLAQRANISRSMHGQYFICVVRSELAFPGEEITCSIGPLDVQSETRTGVPEDSTTDVTTLNPTIDSTRNDFLVNSSISLPIPFETQLAIHRATTDTYLKTVSEPTRVTSETKWNQWETLVVVCAISGALLAILLTTRMTAIVYILDKCKKKDRSQACHGQTTIEMSQKDNNAGVHVVDHLYEDPDLDQDTADNLDITHTYFVDTLPSSLSTSPDSSTYFSEARSSDYDDDEEEFYQPLKKLPEVRSYDSPCSSVYQNQHIVDIHSVSGKNTRKGRPLYRRPPSDHLRGSHRSAEHKPPKLPVRAKPMKGDVPSLGPFLHSGLSCHSPLSPSVSTTLSPVTDPLPTSSVPISLSLSPSSCASVSSSLPCHSKSSNPRSTSLTSPESSSRSQYIFPAFSSLSSFYHTNTPCKKNHMEEETSL